MYGWKKLQVNFEQKLKYSMVMQQRSNNHLQCLTA